MTHYLHRGDLPEGLSFGAGVAVDTEAMGLNPHRDRLCVVQLSAGDGDAHLVQFAPGGYDAPNLKRLLADPAVLKLFHFARFDIAMLLPLPRGHAAAGLLHEDRLAAGPHLYRQARAARPLQGCCSGSICRSSSRAPTGARATLTDEQLRYAASDVLHLHALRERLDSMLAREGRAELARAASSSCRLAPRSTSRAGPSRTSSRISAEGGCRRVAASRASGFDTLDAELGGAVFGGADSRCDRQAAAEPARRRRKRARADRTVSRHRGGPSRSSAPKSDGAEQLARALDGAFGVALDLCAAVRGRLVVTGIGKSGHVARKIAATLASTGTPAQFVHAAEASHGDLGMIGVDDVIVALSNSGESAELADILAYSRRFEIPLVAITGGPRSTLGRGRRCRLMAAARRRGLPDGPGADHLDDDDDGARRRAGDRAARAQGVLARRFPAVPPRRQARPAAAAGRRHHACRRPVPLVAADAPMSEAILVMTRQELRLRRGARRRWPAGRGHHRRRSAPPYGRRAARRARSPRSCTATRRRSPPPGSPPRRSG